MTLPSRYWRLRIETEGGFQEMLQSSFAKSIDLSFSNKVEIGDGICLSSYDEINESGLVRAVGIILNVEGGNIAVKWENADLVLIPNPSGRHYWKDRPYFAFAESVIDRYGLKSVFSEKFPELLEPSLMDERAEKTIHLVQPDAYFKLQILGYMENVPAHLIPHIGRIYTGAEWEALGLIPYSIKTVFPDTDEEFFQFGSVQIDDYSFCFTPMVDLPNNLLKLPEFKQERIALKEWTAAIKHKKRHVSDPRQVYFLRRIGLPYDEISNITEFDRQYSEGRLAMDRQDYRAAITFFEVAARLNPNDLHCKEYLFDSRTKTGDLSVIEEGLAYFANDMDSAVSSGVAEKWLRLAIDVGKDYRLAFDVALMTVSGIQAQISGKTDKTKMIYGPQRISFYRSERDRFIKRLGTLKGFASPALVDANRDRAEELVSLLTQIAKENPAKVNKIDELLRVLRC